MTHTEKVHVIFGVLAALTGGLALWHAFRPRSRAALVWPLLALGIGLALFVPVEAQTRTYVEVGWWDTLLSVVPDSPRYWLNNWFAKLGEWHVVQHKIGGLLIMIVGAVEWRRARGGLQGLAWKFVLPVLLVAIGLSFGIHGGTRAHLPNRTETLHHQVFGLAFVVAGVTKGLVESRRLGGAWRGAWALVVLLVGLDIALLYRLDPVERQVGGRHHESTGTRER